MATLLRTLAHNSTLLSIDMAHLWVGEGGQSLGAGLEGGRVECHRWSVCLDLSSQHHRSRSHHARGCPPPTHREQQTLQLV